MGAGHSPVPEVGSRAGGRLRYGEAIRGRFHRIDGRIYFELADMKDLQSMVVEVKGGKNVNIQALRALRGVLDSEDALMAGLIIMQPLGKVQERNFRKSWRMRVI